MGDTITKEKADSVLRRNIHALSTRYSKEDKYWPKMTDSQKAGFLSLGYNAPYAPIGAYPKLSAAIRSGDMVAAARGTLTVVVLLLPE